jgi:hypothetical protein
MDYYFNLRNRELEIMTVLQLILLATHALVAVIFYTDGKRTGYVEGRKAVRKHYEKLQQVGR